MPEAKKTNSSVKPATATKAPVTEVKKSEVKELTEAIIKAESKKETTKKTVAKKAAAAKKTEAKKDTVKKAAPAKNTQVKKPDTKKAAAKDEEVKVSIELQYSYKHVPYEEIIQNSKNNYQYEMGGNVDEIKKLSIYVKPDEDAAYYVVNDKVQGRIGL
ncbi:MAG: hypothetical protein J6O61_17675 [Butyrivibrio sp.]|uniref:DUF6465 family protein n=1 Tax=Butyrivibrio sp. TaxID=28121 RepID=UPI001B2290E5|nr:DUF6465 family protein [Butyrivibrio sp.]MBO6242633.1 hypothetical protein [Butyrivibrio sp.]